MGNPPSDELALYVVHGLLHVCGLDDIEPADAAVMRRYEAEMMAIPAIPDGCASGFWHSVG